MSEVSPNQLPGHPSDATDAVVDRPAEAIPEHVDVVVSEVMIDLQPDGLPLAESDIQVANMAQPQTESVDAAATQLHPSAMPLGQRLAHQRTTLGYSLEFVANHLKLSQRKIQQLEAGDWNAFPSGPFLSGFIRNYARLLQLDGAEMIALLPSGSSCQPSEPAEIFQGSTFRPAAGRMPQPYGQPFWRKSSFFALLLLVIVVVLTLVLPDDMGHRLREWSAELGRVESAVQQPVLVPVSVANSTDIIGAPSSANGPGVSGAPPVAGELREAPTLVNPLPINAVPVTADERAAEKSNAVAENSRKSAPSVASAAAPVATMLSGPTSELRLKFQGPSWVEVKQKDGSVIASQLNPPNTEKVVSGVAPLALTIGNATSVQLQYKGKVVDLKPFTRDDVAHITLE